MFVVTFGLTGTDGEGENREVYCTADTVQEAETQVAYLRQGGLQYPRYCTMEQAVDAGLIQE